jgi:hypothetical protein
MITVTCCNSIVFASGNADFLATPFYAAYLSGTYTPNGTIYNNRCSIWPLQKTKMNYIIPGLPKVTLSVKELVCTQLYEYLIFFGGSRWTKFSFLLGYFTKNIKILGLL